MLIGIRCQSRRSVGNRNVTVSVLFLLIYIPRSFLGTKFCYLLRFREQATSPQELSRYNPTSPQKLSRYEPTSSQYLSRYKVNIYFVTRKVSRRSSLLPIMNSGKSCFSQYLSSYKVCIHFLPDTILVTKYIHFVPRKLSGKSSLLPIMIMDDSCFFLIPF